MKFNELPFTKPVLDGIKDAGFTDCTEVQEKVLPITLKGKDVMVQSETGSGKTAVYLLTFLEEFQRAKDAQQNTPKCLIVAPTRELAVQIEEDAVKLASHVEIVVGCFYGGVGYEKQEDILSHGCDLFVCTPGRILDFQKAHKIDFRQFDVFIVDEADRLFDMGFYPDIQKMFGLLRDKTERQTMLFSATLGTQVQNLAWQYMNEAQEVEIHPEQITVKEITQELYHVSKDDKFGLFLQVLAKEKPESCLIFSNTKARCIEVAKRLTLNGYPTRYLMGDLPQSKRLSTIDEMKDGKLKFLVATDVAARGLQIDDLAMVVNYDIPEDYESYVHRIGRTARAGKSGKAVTFADEEYVYGLEAIENYIKMKIPVIWPEPGDLPVVEDKTKNMRFRDLVSEREYPSHGDERGGRGGRSSSRGGRHSDSRSSSRGPRRSSSKGRGDRSDRPNRPDRPSSSSRGGRRDENRSPRREEGSRNHKSYVAMQQLSLEERLAYYKKEYGSQVVPNAEKPIQTKAKTAKHVVPNAEHPLPEKKQGFFARLFGRNKKKGN